VVPRAELKAAVTTITGMVPPDTDDDGDWRAELVRRIVTVSGFVKILTLVSGSGQACTAATGTIKRAVGIPVASLSTGAGGGRRRLRAVRGQDCDG
jgi:hypothetical protein